MMGLEAVIFQQDPSLMYGYHQDYTHNINNGHYWDSPFSNSTPQNTNSGSSPENSSTPPVVTRKRGRSKSLKNKEEMENQRRTHIAVERNRRKQMNDYLAVLRSLMPPSYAQRGDQASIVGGAINYVKELEQLLQFLEGHKASIQQPPNTTSHSILSKFLTFPQYITCTNTSASSLDVTADSQHGLADIEVTMVETHANIKVLSKRRPRQLLKIINGLQSIRLTILHLNVSSVDQSVLYSFVVKVEEECEFPTVNEIATAVHGIVGMIQQESSMCCS